MSSVGEREKRTQQRAITFLRDTLGDRYLGHWTGQDNRNIEADLLRGWLGRQGHDGALIAKAVSELKKAAALHSGETLYDANRRVYDLLRYGVKVRPAAGEQHDTVSLVDWEHPWANDFAFDNLPGPPDTRERTAVDVDSAIRRVRKADWRGNRLKEREVRNAIRSTLAGDEGEVDPDAVAKVFEIVKAQHGD